MDLQARIKIDETKVIGGARIFSAWSLDADCATITYDAQGRRWGRLGTERPSAEVLALPRWADRIAAVEAHYAAAKAAAIGRILALNPALEDGTPDFSSGEVLYY